MTWIQTYTGRKFSLVDPQPEDVDILDIAMALSQSVRFSGHCRGLYTVAQHSVLVAEQLPAELRYDGLLHDAPEAYYGDLTRPVKAILYPLTCGGLKRFLKRIDTVVYDALGVTRAHDPAVKHADNVMLATEARDLMGGRPVASTPLPNPLAERIVAWPPHEVCRRFTCCYQRYRPKS